MKARPPGIRVPLGIGIETDAGRESDEGLMTAVRRGDRPSFGKLYRRYWRDVRELCFRWVGDPARAEDLAQETFLRALAHAGDFREGATFWPWISTIARNLCIDELRTRSRMRTVSIEESEEPEMALPASPDTTSEDAIRLQQHHAWRARLVVAFSALSARDRRIVWARAVEERSYEDIARVDRTTVDAVRNVAWRTRAALRALLGDIRDDLHAFVPAALTSLKGLLRRARVRVTDLSNRLGRGEGALVEGATAAFVGLAVLSALLFGFGHRPDLDRPRPPAAAPIEREAAPGQQPEVEGAAAARPGDDRQRGDAPPVGASLEIRSRPGAAAPESAYLRIELRDPEGNVLFWWETWLTCEQLKNSEILLPREGPVQAYC